MRLRLVLRQPSLLKLYVGFSLHSIFYKRIVKELPRRKSVDVTIDHCDCSGTFSREDQGTAKSSKDA